jgi:hypothetical protein
MNYFYQSHRIEWPIYEEGRPMRREKLIVAAAIVILIVSPAMAAQEEGKGEPKDGGWVATGSVIAVTPATRTLVVESQLDDHPWILGLEVPESLAITVGGKTKKLEDLRTGERVRLRWIREQDRLVAESIDLVGATAQ